MLHRLGTWGRRSEDSHEDGTAGNGVGSSRTDQVSNEVPSEHDMPPSSDQEDPDRTVEFPRRQEFAHRVPEWADEEPASDRSGWPTINTHASSPSPFPPLREAIRLSHITL